MIEMRCTQNPAARGHAAQHVNAECVGAGADDAMRGYDFDGRKPEGYAAAFAAHLSPHGRVRTLLERHRRKQSEGKTSEHIRPCKGSTALCTQASSRVAPALHEQRVMSNSNRNLHGGLGIRSQGKTGPRVALFTSGRCCYLTNRYFRPISSLRIGFGVARKKCNPGP